MPAAIRATVEAPLQKWVNVSSKRGESLIIPGLKTGGRSLQISFRAACKTATTHELKPIVPRLVAIAGALPLTGSHFSVQGNCFLGPSAPRSPTGRTKERVPVKLTPRHGDNRVSHKTKELTRKTTGGAHNISTRCAGTLWGHISWFLAALCTTSSAPASFLFLTVPFC